ncbi:ABC transporter ATP-binding protein [Saccharopolyspora taberi]|uniref:ABC transporter ATP-binding protein n=1 Tax=Saccharopolyspora taberi TaxID=60895 RepID=A0ABN3VFX2_9PSEU
MDLEDKPVRGVVMVMPSASAGTGFVRRALVTSWRRSPGLSLCGAVCGALYGCSAAMYGYAIGLATDSVVASSGAGFDGSYVVLVCGLLVLLAAGRCALRLGRRVFANLLQFRMQHATREQVLGEVGAFRRRLPDSAMGQVQSRIGADVDEAWVFLMVPPTAIALVGMTLAGVVLLTTIDVRLAAVGLAGFLAVAWASVVYQQRQEKRTRVAQNLRGDIATTAGEIFAKHATIAGFSGESRHQAEFDRVSDALRDARLSVGRVRSLFEALLDTIVPANTVVMLIVGVLLVEGSAISGGGVVQAVFLTNLLFTPLRGLGPLLAELPRSQSSLGRLTELLDVQPGAAVTPRPSDEGVAWRACRVELRNATVEGDSDQVGVKGLDLVIRPGRPVVVAGTHEDGVDTVTALVRGDIEPDSGSVVRLQEDRTRAGLVLVEEHPFVLAASLWDNICLGAELPADEFRSVIGAAALEPLIRKLPDGAGSLLREEGKSLSAGERQRVGIARALAKRPALIVLDGTTSSLDVVTEHRILTTLAEMSSPPAVMVVTRQPRDPMEHVELVRLRAGRKEDGPS